MTNRPGENVPLSVELDEEMRALLEQWESGYRGLAPTTQEGSMESGRKISEIESLFASFESTYSLRELHAIVDLRPEDARAHPLREPAKEALCPIFELLRSLSGANISPIKFEELKEKYTRCSQAVGIIRNNKVEHDRKLGDGPFW